MGSWVLLTVAFVSALVGLSQSCSPCPFQWMENGNYCYRYFPEDLSYNEAEMFCKQFSHTGHVAELATVSTLEELTFIMGYLDNVYVNVPAANIPMNVWLMNITQNIPDIVPILDRTMGPTKSHVSSCDSVPVSGDWFQLGGDTNLIEIVPAPDVIDHACAVYAKTGVYLDIGDFSGTCVSDPDLCESMTWFLWLKIDTSSGFTGERYYISSGEQTSQARGLAFLFYTDRFRYGIKTLSSSYVAQYSMSKIPQNIWFHLTLTFDAMAVGDAIQLYVNGVAVARDSYETIAGAASDGCTKLYMGHSNTCSVVYDSIYGGSAAYSDLTVFDGLLTQDQIRDMYSCGSHEWALMVRSLVMKSNREYECVASDPSGPIITWSLYHKQTDSWENLDTSGDDYTIQSVNVSTCVVRSTLVMSSSQVSPTAVACTAQAGSNKASVTIYTGKKMTFSFSDQKHTGIPIFAEGSLVHFTNKFGYEQDGSSPIDQAKYPFICKIPDKMH
ncbi:uncharacterized protein LOC117299411 [Asterias rubens]|uniref:uncharacterized protein LOC117299411 n=1 Tax=Asterias rubens TaxID=7604 RepID=UPI001455CA9A|nr:uncharacterized protein LOC117299411 [Asterias rubens]